MKNRTYIHPATLFIFLSISLIVCSWIGSGYGWTGVQNLLSIDALRWMLRHVEENFMYSSAFAMACMLFFGFGLVVHSGLGDALHRLVLQDKILSRKQKRALALAGLTALIYSSLCCLLVWGPWGILRSVTGMFEGSPLQDGILIIISFGFGLCGTIYGFSVDTYRRDKDIYQGMSCLFSKYADYFVSLFFIEQFFASLTYSGMIPFLQIPVEVVNLLYVVSCIYPFFLKRKHAYFH